MERSYNPDNSKYLIDPGLESVLDMAVKLGMPLLVTGEPGTGKTRLAKYVANKFKAKLKRFNTKTTSKAKDLLYRYNALTHFRDSQMQGNVQNGLSLNPMDYVHFEALGEAIIHAHKERYVVLVDEIDKAPRDFPNDVLFEFEQLAFAVDEASERDIHAWLESQENPPYREEQGFFSIRKDANQPILVLTSNSEKNLPDAFLRRCAYYHIPFPDRERLLAIVEANQPLEEALKKQMVEDAIDHFLQIRDLGLRKAPATAELLAWIHILREEGVDVKKGLEGDNRTIREKIENTYSILAKNREDLERIIAEFTSA